MYANDDFERLVDDECARLAAHPKVHAFNYRIGRVMVRTLRVACGAIAAVVVWMIGQPVVKAMNKPLVTLTLGDLAGIVGAGCGVLLLFMLAWAVAFGSGPKRPDVLERATTRVRKRQQLQAEAEAATATNAARVAAHRARYAWFGRPGLALLSLNDAIERRPWAGLLISAALCVGLGLLVYWLGRGAF